MKQKGFQLLLLCMVTFGFSETDSLPVWLDTVAPLVTISPREKYHREMFHITLKMNEPGKSFIGYNSSKYLRTYNKPFTILKPGKHRIFFYAEDEIGNSSALDSMTYVLDNSAPVISIEPPPGMYSDEITIRISTNEHCKYYLQTDTASNDIKQIADTFHVENTFSGYISATDSAGNTSRIGPLRYTIDTSRISIACEPKPGVYNDPSLSVSFVYPPGARLFYTLDPTAPPKWFTEYSEPVLLPAGISLIRYFTVNNTGLESDIKKATYVIDTTTPRLRHEHVRGTDYDTLKLFSSEPAQIRFARSENASLGPERIYRGAIQIAREGKGYIKAMARDSAGNMSDLFVWQHAYDTIPPLLWPSTPSGTYNKPFALRFRTSEDAKVFYSLDGSPANERSMLYQDSILVSRKGVTKVRFIAVDIADNHSKEDSCLFVIDDTPPSVKARVEGNLGSDLFYVTLKTNEPAVIYYETGNKKPDLNSSVYNRPIALRNGTSLRYFAKDSAGNVSEMYRMDELISPMVSMYPEGGVFNAEVPIKFTTNMPSTVYMRILPDSIFHSRNNPLVLKSEGVHVIEYYASNAQGMRSPVRRNEFLLDWTAPRVNVSMRKGRNDSITVFFKCNENAVIYYTLDGSSPLFSPTTRVAGNKFTMSHDRISIKRSTETKLAFYAEDQAGNQSMVSVLDVAKPRVIPNLPAGSQKVYDRILSVRLNTYDDNSQIYYERHGKSPDLNSAVYSKPLTVTRSDTIIAFVMDVSGFRGDPDTFVYKIDLPPIPRFKAEKDTVSLGKPIRLDAGETFDRENRLEELTYSWDFDSDGIIDSVKESISRIDHAYDTPGRYMVTLHVTDPLGRGSSISKEVYVLDKCPPGMRSIPGEGDRSFCIDIYEWPNIRGKIPQNRVSWVEAKMQCRKEGKRLCTAYEWEYACKSGRQFRYPYGRQYKKGKCTDSHTKAQKSGKFSDCGGGFGLFDMVGNLWEWVDSGDGPYPVMMGGAYSDGQSAHCEVKSIGNASEANIVTGFRCCK